MFLFTTFSYEPVRLFTVKEAIDFIHSHHGLACLAHPWLCSNAMEVCEDTLKLQVDGMECFPPRHHASFGTEQFVTFAKEHCLFCSGGSDFHWAENCEVDVGDNCFPEEEAIHFLDVLNKHGII